MVRIIERYLTDADQPAWHKDVVYTSAPQEEVFSLSEADLARGVAIYQDEISQLHPVNVAEWIKQRDPLYLQAMEAVLPRLQVEGEKMDPPIAPDTTAHWFLKGVALALAMSRDAGPVSSEQVHLFKAMHVNEKDSSAKSVFEELLERLDPATPKTTTLQEQLRNGYLQRLGKTPGLEITMKTLHLPPFGPVAKGVEAGLRLREARSTRRGGSPGMV